MGERLIRRTGHNSRPFTACRAGGLAQADPFAVDLYLRRSASICGWIWWFADQKKGCKVYLIGKDTNLGYF